VSATSLVVNAPCPTVATPAAGEAYVISGAVISTPGTINKKR